jgi:probable rRNA maturation factor
MAIQFFAKATRFKPVRPRSTSTWIKNSIKNEGKSLSDLAIIFCKDKFLLDLNVQYLGHNTLTDIITFDYSEDPKTIDGEIYISVERVRENATKYQNTFDVELHRVIIHGVLHLIGYGDKTPGEKAKMREKEEAYLSLR